MGNRFFLLIIYLLFITNNQILAVSIKMVGYISKYSLPPDQGSQLNLTRAEQELKLKLQKFLHNIKLLQHSLYETQSKQNIAYSNWKGKLASIKSQITGYSDYYSDTTEWKVKLALIQNEFDKSKSDFDKKYQFIASHLNQLNLENYDAELIKSLDTKIQHLNNVVASMNYSYSQLQALEELIRTEAENWILETINSDGKQMLDTLAPRIEYLKVLKNQISKINKTGYFINSYSFNRLVSVSSDISSRLTTKHTQLINDLNSTTNIEKLQTIYNKINEFNAQVTQAEQDIDDEIESSKNISGDDLSQTGLLDISIEYQCPEFLNELLSSGADVKYKNYYAETLWHIMSGPVEYEENDAIENLRLALIDNSVNINSKDHLGRTPLHDASYNGKTDIIKMLINVYKADNAQQDDLGKTSCDYAATTEIQALLCKGDVYNILDAVDLIEQQQEQSNKLLLPMQHKLVKARLDSVQALIDAIFAVSNLSPFYNQIQNEQVKIDEYWVEYDDKIANNSDMFSLENKIKTSQQNIVNFVDSENHTMLHSAIMSEQQNLTTLLLQNGADINAQNNIGETPLHKAASIGHDNIVLLLVSNGAKVNALNFSNETPLYLAEKNEHNSVISLLKQHGGVI